MIQIPANIIFPICVFAFLLTSAAFGSERFGISYLWHSDASAILDYHKRVAHVLGPAVEKNLNVVTNGKLYGLVYLRNNADGASAVAQSHSRILRAMGMDKAVPLSSNNWAIITHGTDLYKKQSTNPNWKDSRSNNSTPAESRLNIPLKKPQKVRDIESAVENYIKKLRQSGNLNNDERTGWSVYDFTSGEKLVSINEDVKFQAASLVKPFIALAFFHQVKQGKLIYGPKSRRHMKRMIHHSNNRSTNWVIRQVGGPAVVEKILKRDYPGIFKDTHIVEYIPADGRTYLNKASAHDYSRFLYALWNGDLPRSKEIKHLMALPGTDRLLTDVENIPRGTKVYNKTGSTSRLCGDMGILIVKGQDGKRYPYTLIGIIEKQVPAKNYTTWIRSRADVIRNVSQIVYQGIAQQHDLEELL